MSCAQNTNQMLAEESVSLPLSNTSKKNVRFEIEAQHEYEERRNAIELEGATQARKNQHETLRNTEIYGLRLLDNYYKRVDPRELPEADRVAHYENLTQEWNTMMALNEPILVPLSLLNTAEDQVRALMHKVDLLQKELDVSNMRIEMLEESHTNARAASSFASPTTFFEGTSKAITTDATTNLQLPEHAPDGSLDVVGTECGCCCEVLHKLAMKCDCGGVLCEACYRDLIDDDGTITCQSCCDFRDADDNKTSALDEPATPAWPIAHVEVTPEHIVGGALKELERDQLDALGDYASCCDAIDLMSDLVPGAMTKLAPRMPSVDETVAVVSNEVTKILRRFVSTVVYWG